MNDRYLLETSVMVINATVDWSTKLNIPVYAQSCKKRSVPRQSQPIPFMTLPVDVFNTREFGAERFGKNILLTGVLCYH